MIRFPTFEIIDRIKKTEGALSICEAIFIANAAYMAPSDDTWIELGSYKGKSALAATAILEYRKYFVLIDPIYSDEGIVNKVSQIVYGRMNPHLISAFSPDILNKYDKVAYCLVDSGNHAEGLPMSEVKALEDKMVPGGIITMHDIDSQFVEVREAYDYLLSTGKYEEVKFDWGEIIEFVKKHDLEKGNNSWHHPELEFPQFVAALKRIK